MAITEPSKHHFDVMGVFIGAHIVSSQKKVLITTFVLFLSACNSDSSTTNVGGYNNNNWQLVWFDEFSGSSIDTSKWSWATNCWGGGNNELQCYTDRLDNSYIQSGSLIIKARQETFTGPAEPLGSNTNAGNRTLPYTSARLLTKNKGDWKYGRIEVRAKLPAGQGIWPAIWMLPTHDVYGSWAASGEIDIMESVNINPSIPSTHKVHGNLHFGGSWPLNTHVGNDTTLGKDPSQNFHTYAIDWAADQMRWYVDGVLYGTIPSSSWYSTPSNSQIAGPYAPFDQDFHLLLNVAVGGNWPGAPDHTSSLPVQMEVDYVRVYSCQTAPSSLSSCQ